VLEHSYKQAGKAKQITILSLSDILAICLLTTKVDSSLLLKPIGFPMSLSFNSSISGIRAATDVLSTSAHNIANSNTDGYKKQRVNLRSDDGSGVIADITESTEAGSLYINKRGETVETSNVNYIEEVVTQIKARHLLSANAAAIKYADVALETIIDIIA